MTVPVHTDLNMAPQKSMESSFPKFQYTVYITFPNVGMQKKGGMNKTSWEVPFPNFKHVQNARSENTVELHLKLHGGDCCS